MGNHQHAGECLGWCWPRRPSRATADRDRAHARRRAPERPALPHLPGGRAGGLTPVTVGNGGSARCRPGRRDRVRATPPVTEPAAVAGLCHRAQPTTSSTARRWTRLGAPERQARGSVLKVTEPEAKMARLLLVDLLPAGFEIDNPSLVDSTGRRRSHLAEAYAEPSSAEYRDDRFVAAIRSQPKQPAFFHARLYRAGAAPGRYVHPPAPWKTCTAPSASDGRPTVRSRSAAGSDAASIALRRRRGLRRWRRRWRGGVLVCTAALAVAAAALWRFVDASRTSRPDAVGAGVHRRA